MLTCAVRIILLPTAVLLSPTLTGRTARQPALSSIHLPFFLKTLTCACCVDDSHHCVDDSHCCVDDSHYSVWMTHTTLQYTGRSHASIPEEERTLPPDLIRLSVGYVNLHWPVLRVLRHQCLARSGVNKAFCYTQSRSAIVNAIFRLLCG